MTHKIWISTGGTGGHLFPALALAAQLRVQAPESEILFLGGGLSTSRYFDREAHAHLDIACGSFVSKNPFNLMRNTSRIARGIWQSRRAILTHRPDVLVGFGSFYSLPPIVAARLSNVPLILHAADSIPGRVIRFMSRYAALTVLQFPEAAQHLHGPSAVAKMPLRAALTKGGISPAEARRRLNLDPELRTVLVFGGSQGARRINQLVSEAIPPQTKTYQILHYTGDETVATQLTELYQLRGIRACVKSFETQMELAWSAADLVIGRSGASTIGELCEYEVPGILIPYPYAMDNHQEKNADSLAARTGGVIRIRESELTSQILADQLASLFANDAQQLLHMQQALASAKAATPQQTLCDLVIKTLRKDPSR